jgi:hypothetical protein
MLAHAGGVKLTVASAKVRTAHRNIVRSPGDVFEQRTRGMVTVTGVVVRLPSLWLLVRPSGKLLAEPPSGSYGCEIVCEFWLTEYHSLIRHRGGGPKTTPPFPHDHVKTTYGDPMVKGDVMTEKYATVSRERRSGCSSLSEDNC